MSKVVPLYPALVRADVLSAPLQDELMQFLASAKEHGLKAIGLEILATDGEIYHLAGLTTVFLNQGSHKFRYRVAQFLPPELQEQARRVALDLLESTEITGALETIDPDRAAFSSNGTYSLFFFSGCAILSVGDPRARLQSDAFELRKHPDLIGNRAPVCSIFLPETTSNHERAAQPPKVLEALSVWRDMNGLDWPAALQDLDLSLGTPTQMEIMSCMTTHLS